MCEIMRSLVIFSLVCYWLYQFTHNHNISVASQSTEEDTVFVNGTVAIGSIDDDFVCATIDWWPPEKCDYGTCSWGSASLLHLVSDHNPPQLISFPCQIVRRPFSFWVHGYH